MMLFAVLIIALLESTTAQKRLNNIGFIGRGYDIYVGNPQSTLIGGDPGFKVPVLSLLYTQNLTTPDGRFIIPDTVDVEPVLECSYESLSEQVFGETSYVNSLKISLSGNLNIGPGAFSASFDYHRLSNQTNTMKQVAVTTRAQCSVYKASVLAFLTTPVHPNFARAVSFLSTLSTDPNTESNGYFKVIGTFGTHYTTGITMGGACFLQSMFEQKTFYSLLQKGFSFSLGASGSFKLFSGAIKLMTEQETTSAKTYDSNRTSLFQSYLGSRPSVDGQWQTWAATVSDEPYPFLYVLQPISDLVTPDNFPNIQPDVLASVQSKLVNYLSKYCPIVKGAACSGPRPDRVPPTIVSNSGLGDIHVSCPKDFTMIASGFSRSSPENEVYATYLLDSFTSGVCHDTFGASCSGLCTNSFQPSDISVVSKTSHGVATTVDCPPKTMAAHCGFQIRSLTPFPYSYLSSPTSCTCYGVLAECQAVCLNATKLLNYEIKTAFGTGTFDVTCPDGKQSFGCGYQTTVAQARDPAWWVTPTTTGCTCNNAGGATCFTSCASL